MSISITIPFEEYKGTDGFIYTGIKTITITVSEAETIINDIQRQFPAAKEAEKLNRQNEIAELEAKLAKLKGVS